MAVAVKTYRAFQAPKRGYSAEECQDAFAVDLEAGRFAVADGATESAESGFWAALLANAFMQGGPDPWREWLAPLQGGWDRHVKVPDADELWFLEQRYRDGAYSTFLGVWLRGEHWKGVAVGDSCLFHVRDNRLLASYPMESPSQFGVTPKLIGSREAADLPEPENFAGSLRPGDQLLLMTDALACWFLTAAERGEEPWAAIEGLVKLSDDDFAAWVERLRDRRELKNDDTTVVAVYLHE
jgi:hypothetical protein